MTKINYNDLALKLTASLEKKVARFPSRRKLHFAERLYRITGNRKYLSWIKEFINDNYPVFLTSGEILGNIEAEREFGLKSINRLSSLSPLKAPRWQYYQNFPELKFYQSLVYLLNKFSEYQIVEITSQAKYKQSIAKLEQINWSNYLLNKDFIYFDPVQGINQVFWLKNLGIIDLITPFLEKCKSIYPPNVEPPKESFKFHNHFYSYTHIIIADSYYYQRFVSPSKYSWVISFLKTSIPQALKGNNCDLIAEIGCCFKLCQLPPEISNQLKVFLVNKIKPATGLLSLPSSKPSLVEHANVLAIILLRNWKKLYKGPKISIN